MKERFKNVITTVIGIPILLLGLFMAYMRIRSVFDSSVLCDFTWMQVVQTIFLGWLLVVAKDSLIKEGLLMRIFGVKKP